MSAKLLVDASNYSNRRKNDSFESGLEKIQKESRLSKAEPKQCRYQSLPSDTLLATRRLMDNRSGGEEQSRSGSRCNQRSDVNLAERGAFGG
ncbi:hypothetical protein KOW79_015213 [Hemibagrus wyckioides]|uniref:Uncharacterized protein n=1 Tax=Hemibagrus wyckioides TaxID=337641 RepID=A0A9D3ND84_9TELE|nr:hypothetical protein KOW79_015213 [Hemibagrus wyckioides]